jgi:hypothetical protein
MTSTADLGVHMARVARALLGDPNPKLSSKKQLRYGNRGSLAIDLAKGTFYDHEAGEGGGVLALINRQKGLTGKDAFAFMREIGCEVGANARQIVAAYDYSDEAGMLLFQVVRYEPKDFRQRRPDGRGGWVWSVKGVQRVPYRLPDVTKALVSGRRILIVEGEKDADRLWSLGVPTTCNAGGAGNWPNELCKYFRGTDMVILPDNDPQSTNPKDGTPQFHPDGRPKFAGQDHAGDVAAMLAHVAANVRILELPGHKDVSDWFNAGGTVERLNELIEKQAIPWTEYRGPTGNGASTSATDGPSPLSQWDDPDQSILDDRRGDLPEFPDNVFSPPLRECLERTAAGAGVTTAHVAIPLLGIASGQIGVARQISPSSSWSEPCTMWMATVGCSGAGKTPGIDVTKRVLAAIERDRMDKIAALQLEHETRVESANAVAKKWKEDVQAAIKQGVPPPKMPADAIDPGLFVAPRLFLSNATVERIAVLLQARKRGMLFIADELAALFLNMGRYSKGQDNEFWLESWGGKSYTVERIGRPPLALPHLLVGIVGGFQPDKLARSFGGDADGMYARFCFSWPAEPKYRPLSNDAEEIDPLICKVLSRLIDLPSEENGVFASRKVRLTTGAK